MQQQLLPLFGRNPVQQVACCGAPVSALSSVMRRLGTHRHKSSYIMEVSMGYKSEIDFMVLLMI